MWKESDEDSNILVRGALLAEATRWLDSRTEDLSKQEQAFIRLSQEKANEDFEARIQARAREAELERTTAELERMSSQLSQASDLQIRFVSDVSHELRTPLATVRMASDYIHDARTGLPPDAQRASILLERELERFERLLEDLLELSRFDAGVVTISDPRQVDLADLLDEVIEALSAMAHGYSVQISLDINRRDGPPLVRGDPRRLDRVFASLVQNAIQHSAGGDVLIRVARETDKVVVTVTDTGEGIPAEDVSHLFERFYRADVHRARTLGGSGLGLPIALENLTLHNGSIDVYSEVGHGATFTVTLPATDPEDPEPLES
jgi:two-component system sensor histidine kinase MtrB